MDGTERSGAVGGNLPSEASDVADPVAGDPPSPVQNEGGIAMAIITKTLEERVAELETYLPVLERIAAWEGWNGSSLPEQVNRLHEGIREVGRVFSETRDEQGRWPVPAAFVRPADEPETEAVTALRDTLEGWAW